MFMPARWPGMFVPARWLKCVYACQVAGHVGSGPVAEICLFRPRGQDMFVYDFSSGREAVALRPR